MILGGIGMNSFYFNSGVFVIIIIWKNIISIIYDFVDFIVYVVLFFKVLRSEKY